MEIQPLTAGGRITESRVAWSQAARLVPARYRPADCFERLAQDMATQDLQAILADCTSAGLGDLAAMDPSRILFGQGAGWINAPFLAPRAGRFSTASHGAFYAARELETSVAEVKYHLELSYRDEAVEQPQDLEYRALRVHLEGTYHDIRAKARAKAISRTSPAMAALPRWPRQYPRSVPGHRGTPRDGIRCFGFPGRFWSDISMGWFLDFQ